MLRFVLGEGPVPCTGMIVGEAPGAEEDKQGRPFVGASGKLLDEALEAAGIHRPQIYVTNVYKLRPEGNRNPTQEEIDAHWPYLEDELNAVNPIGVLLLGNVALHTFFPDVPGITQVRGHIFQGMFGEQVSFTEYWATYHPAYVLYQNGDSSIRHTFFEDVAEFVNHTMKLI